MLYRATFQTNGVQTLLLLLDANERTSVSGDTWQSDHQFPEAAFWIVRRDANHT